MAQTIIKLITLSCIKNLRKPKQLDRLFNTLHDEFFEEMDCSCANCCKTRSPIFYQADVDRVAQVVNMKPSLFIEKDQKIDQDGDYVL